MNRIFKNWLLACTLLAGLVCHAQQNSDTTKTFLLGTLRFNYQGRLINLNDTTLGCYVDTFSNGQIKTAAVLIDSAYDVNKLLAYGVAGGFDCPTCYYVVNSGGSSDSQGVYAWTINKTEIGLNYEWFENGQVKTSFDVNNSSIGWTITALNFDEYGHLLKKYQLAIDFPSSTCYLEGTAQIVDLFDKTCREKYFSQSRLMYEEVWQNNIYIGRLDYFSSKTY